jgi:hypothetical protein
MQHTVIAFFDTYSQAEAAREALVAAGVSSADVTLKARCEPTYASDATTAGTAQAGNEGLLASIERFFESLFVDTTPPRETAYYAEAVRRGAVMLSVDAATDAAAALARTTLESMGPIDIHERAATWQAPGDEALRERSPLEELGLKRSTGVRASAVHTHAHTGERLQPGRPDASVTPVAPAAPLADDVLAVPADSEAAATAVAAGSAPGMGAVFAAGHAPLVPEPRAQATPAAPAAAVPDEYLQNEESHGDAEGRRG